jgi:thiol:disulfide interchange protein DsbA
VQLFAYDCGVCYSLEQPLAAWLDAHRDEVALVRMPVQWNPRAARLARAFYAADSLGKADEIGAALFEEIHTRGNALDDDDALAGIFARFGIDRAELERVVAAPTTEASASRARTLEDGFGITTVPSVVVGGELVTDRVLAGTPERMLAIVEQLVECVERERKSPEVPVARHC